MASTPAFASLPVILAGAVSVANTSRTGSSGTIVDLAGSGGVTTTAPTAGRRIERIVVASTGQPADSIITIFVNDGTTTWYFDEFDVGTAAPAAGSTTVSPYRAERPYEDLVLPSGWKLRAAVTVAPTSGVINVIALGADLS